MQISDDSRPVTIMMVEDSPQGTFCCPQPNVGISGFDAKSGLCGFPNQGSHIPFSLDEGLPILNRSDGAISPDKLNLTQSSSSPVTTGHSAQHCPTSSRASAGGDHQSTIAAVGAGVGVPLGIVWLVTLALLVWKWRQAQQCAMALRGQSIAQYQDHGQKSIAQYLHGQSRSELDPSAMRTSEMAGVPVNELDAWRS